MANRFSRRSLVDPNSPVVISTTTHGRRIDRVHIAIESVARGTMRPRRHMLWLDDASLMDALPSSIRRLQRRGLEVVLTKPGYRVHTKHYPYVAAVAPHELDLATCDDDIVYPASWLANLWQRRAEFPDAIVVYRAHRVRLDGDGIAPYSTWTPVLSTEPSILHFGTTVSGQLYPPAFLDLVREAGEAFLDSAPTNDDIWLHHLAVGAGVATVQVTKDQQHFPFVPGTQAHGLFFTNITDGQNDVQNAKSYTPAEVAALRAADAAYEA